MGRRSNPSVPDDPADLDAMRRHATALADAMVLAIPEWIERLVLERAVGAGVDVARATREARMAAQEAIAEGEPRLRALLEADIDAQRSTPLAVVRSLVRHANLALDRLGVVAAPRPGFDRDAFPDDTHGLTPAAFADVSPALHEPGIVWGAAKAHMHLRRHKR